MYKLTNTNYNSQMYKLTNTNYKSQMYKLTNYNSQTYILTQTTSQMYKSQTHKLTNTSYNSQTHKLTSRRAQRSGDWGCRTACHWPGTRTAPDTTDKNHSINTPVVRHRLCMDSTRFTLTGDFPVFYRLTSAYTGNKIRNQSDILVVVLFDQF